MSKRISRAQRTQNRIDARTLDAARAQFVSQLGGMMAFGTGGFSGGGFGVEPPPQKDPAWRPAPRDARSDTLLRLPLQRAQSRDLARTSPIGAGAINTNVDRVVGTGLALSSQPHLKVLGWTPPAASAS